MKHFKNIEAFEKEEKLEWVNNNWFEVTWKIKGTDLWDCELGIVAYNYDEAIRLLESYLDEYKNYGGD